MKRFFIVTGKIVLLLLLLGLLLQAGVFFAVKYGFSDVSGEVDENSFEYNELVREIREIEIADLGELDLLSVSSSSSSTRFGLPKTESIFGPRAEENWCKIKVASDYNVLTGKAILEAYNKSRSEILLNNMLLAMKLRLSEKEKFASDLEGCKKAGELLTAEEILAELDMASTTNLYTWQNGEPWEIISEAIKKDEGTIKEVSEKVGIQARLLVSVAIVEQLRLYYTQRELFEKVFKPLKILANANKMAWGIMSIKEKMAIQTEEHLKDTSSFYYLGTSTENILDYQEGVDKNKERYARLTDEINHYYSYLYGALIIKQLETQWEKSGYPIKYRPEIVATLFNIGFNNSKPKENPQVGGSTIEIENEKYYFGSLAYEFYYSGVMTKEFPFE